MKNFDMNWKLQLALSVAAFLPVSVVMANSSIEETRPMAMDGLLRVDNMAGSIEVTVWDKAEVRITGELGEDVEELEIRTTSSGLDISVVNTYQRTNIADTQLRLQIPVTASLETESVSADVKVVGLKSANLSLDSVSGDFHLDAETERLQAETVSGDIHFRGRANRMTVETVSGDIEVEGAQGEARAGTVSGDVRFAGSELERARFESVSGELELDLDLVDGGRFEAENMSGDVELRLPAGQKAEFDVQTFSGKIRSDFGTVTERSHGGGSALSLRVEDSATTIEIESFSGDVTISGR